MKLPQHHGLRLSSIILPSSFCQRFWQNDGGRIILRIRSESQIRRGRHFVYPLNPHDDSCRSRF